jgi:cyclopropane fatty-acyl-phospholipid synthase-like methyltransferase
LIKEDEDWDDIYRDYSLEDIPWHSDEPDESLVDLLKNKKIKIGVALNVCSGAGTNSIYLAKNGFNVTGVDISKIATEISVKRAEDAGVSKSCKFLSGDMLKLKLPKNTFDFIFDRGCYHHISKKDKPYFVKIVSDTLKKGAKYFLICFSDKNPPWEKNVSKDEIRKNFSKYFNIGKIKGYPAIEKTGRKLDFYLTLMTKK